MLKYLVKRRFPCSSSSLRQQYFFCVLNGMKPIISLAHRTPNFMNPELGDELNEI